MATFFLLCEWKLDYSNNVQHYTTLNEIKYKTCSEPTQAVLKCGQNIFYQDMNINSHTTFSGLL